MERRNFIKNCCLAGVGISAASQLLMSCDAIYYASVTKSENLFSLEKSEFMKGEPKENKFRKYVLIKKANLPFPICVYRINEEEYHASLMKCTHNGCELIPGGEIFTCPCHGAEFSNQGKVLTGPAEEDLQVFKTTFDKNNVYVHF